MPARDAEEEEEEHDGAEVNEPVVLPVRPIVVLALAFSAHTFTISSLFAYAGLLSVDLGWAADEDTAGYVAGFLAGALTSGRVPTSAAWGLFTDRFGTRLAMTLSMTALSLGNLLFGFARDLRVALAVRFFMLGSLNGFVTLIGIVTAEIGGLERQTAVFTRGFTAGGAMHAVAPTLAGLTYGSIARWPALAPSCIASIIGALAATASWCWLPPKKKQEEEHKKRSQVLVVEKEVNEDDDDDGDALLSGEKKRGDASWWRAPSMALVVALRAVFGLQLFATFDVIPLWAISSRSVGGLEWKQRRLGLMLGLAATCFVPWVYFAVPRILEGCGLRRAVAASSLAAALALVLTPRSTGFLGALFGQVCIELAVSTVEPALTAATNNAAPPTAARGALNGIVTTVEAVFKAMGPPLAGVLYAHSIERSAGDGHYLCFYILAGLALAVAVGALRLSPSVESPASRHRLESNGDG